MAQLLLHPDERLHVRELARRTDMAPGTLHRELGALASLDLLRREQVGRQVLYFANRESPFFEELAGLLRKSSGLADVLRHALAPLRGRITAAFVYGAVASGAAVAASDIDVMVVGGVAFTELIAALHDTQATLRREVNPTLFDADDLVRKRNTGFVRSVLAGPKIWLIGGPGDLGKPAEDRSDQAAPAESRRSRPTAGAAARSLRDARNESISDESRFDCAYRAITQLAIVALTASGYRPATDRPGHHQTMIQSLPLTVGASRETWLVLDALRRQRNLIDYTGAELGTRTTMEAITEAERLDARVREWLAAEHSSLVDS